MPTIGPVSGEFELNATPGFVALSGVDGPAPRQCAASLGSKSRCSGCSELVVGTANGTQRSPAPVAARAASRVASRGRDRAGATASRNEQQPNEQRLARLATGFLAR